MEHFNSEIVLLYCLAPYCITQKSVAQKVAIGACRGSPEKQGKRFTVFLHHKNKNNFCTER